MTHISGVEPVLPTVDRVHSPVFSVLGRRRDIVCRTAYPVLHQVGIVLYTIVVTMRDF